MKKIFLTFFILISLIFISWKFSDVKFEDPNKDKLLVELLKYVLDKGHYQSTELNDEFSENVFDKYLELLDPQKKYFLATDLKEFKKYRRSLDDQWKDYDITFFNLTYDRLIKRIDEVELLIPEIFEIPFEFETIEIINTDFENLDFPNNKKEKKERWRKQLKYSVLDFYDIKVKDQENLSKKNDNHITKSDKQLIEEASNLAKDNILDILDLMDDLQKEDWFSSYINSFASQYDPHTVYFKPEDKDRFDVNISGRFDGIGARLLKKDRGIEIVEIILGGPLWKDKSIELGDQIIKVGEPNKDPVDVIGMRVDDAIKLIKGPKGTVVELTVRKKIDNEIKTYSIERD